MVDYQKLSDEGSTLPQSSWNSTRAPLVEATEIETRDVSPKQIEEWQNAIKGPWQKLVSSIRETGTVLLNIRSQIVAAHGERSGVFGKLFKGPNRPFSKRTALMLMAIADDEVIAKYTTRCPCCWYTLYMFAKSDLTREEKVALIESGDFNPDTEQRDFKDLLNRIASNKRRAAALSSEIDSKIKGEDEPPRPRVFGAPKPKETPAIHKYRLEKQLALLIVEMEDAHDLIWHDTECRTKIQRLIDRGLRITDERPKFKLTPPEVEETSDVEVTDAREAA